MRCLLIDGFRLVPFSTDIWPLASDRNWSYAYEEMECFDVQFRKQRRLESNVLTAAVYLLFVNCKGAMTYRILRQRGLLSGDGIGREITSHLLFYEC